MIDVYAHGDTIIHDFNTFASDGSLTSIAGTPAVGLFQGAIEIVCDPAIVLTTNIGSVNGVHRVSLDATDTDLVDGYYSIRYKSGSVDDIDQTGVVIYEFRLAIAPLSSEDTRLEYLDAPITDAASNASSAVSAANAAKDSADSAVSAISALSIPSVSDIRVEMETAGGKLDQTKTSADTAASNATDAKTAAEAAESAVSGLSIPTPPTVAQIQAGIERPDGLLKPVSDKVGQIVVINNKVEATATATVDESTTSAIAAGVAQELANQDILQLTVVAPVIGQTNPAILYQGDDYLIIADRALQVDIDPSDLTSDDVVKLKLADTEIIGETATVGDIVRASFELTHEQTEILPDGNCEFEIEATGDTWGNRTLLFGTVTVRK